MERWCQKIILHCFLVMKFVSSATNQPFAKQLRLMEIPVKGYMCKGKIFVLSPPSWGFLRK